MAQAFGLVQSSGYSPAPAGKQPAILAEIAWELVANRFEEQKEPELKMFWCFQLEATDKEGEPYIMDLELYPNISAKNAVGKLCRSWSASPQELTQEQMNQWRCAVMGKLISRDSVGNPVLDEKGIVQIQQFNSVEEFLDNYDPDPPLVGLTAVVEIEHRESSKSGRTYARIVNIFPNAKLDAVGNVVKGKDGRPDPAFTMELKDYRFRAERQAEIQKRIAEKEARGKEGNRANNQARAKKVSDIPF